MTTKIKAGVIEAGAISTASLADTSITADKLHTTLDLTGKTVTVATATAGDNDTTVASTAFVTTAIANLTDSAPAALDTLNELAAALNDDANFSTTVTNSIALKAPLASPTFTGTLTASGLVYPTSDGTNGQALVTNGSGTLSFSTIQGYTDSDVETYLNTSEIYTDATNNRLGIGTSSPDELLHVKGTNGAIAIDGNGSSNTASIKFINDNERSRITSAYDSGGGGRLTFHTDTTGGSLVERLRIDASGNVGIGTSAPLAKLDVVRGGPTGLTSVNARTALLVQNNLSNGTVLSINAKNTGYSGIFLGDQDNEAMCQIQYVHTNDRLKFLTNSGGDNPLTLSGANVGIGTSSPTTPLHVYHATTDTVANFQSGDNSVAVNFTALDNSMQIATSSTDGIIKNNGAGSFRLFNNGSERARIDSSGNVLVGKTATDDFTVVGTQIDADGFIAVTREGSVAALFNRETSDGDILQFRKDNTTVGSIGTSSDQMYIGHSDTGIRFTATADDIRPWNPSTGAIRDAAIDLGDSAGRFKDLYLSGTANFGSLSDGTITITAFVDEDNMASNSATLVPTQQSVKAYVDAEVAGIVDSAPGALDTLNELAAALGDDANFSTTVTNSIATKAPIASPSFTGNITVAGDGFFNGTKLEGDSKEMIRYSDAWLRLNPANEFTTGIYCGNGLLRTDGEFQVGGNGAYFKVTSTGNVTLAGTLDGRDIASDGSKLDGIESGATADQTAAQILTAIKTVDGAGSGLDADLLDGQQGSYYAPASTALTTSTSFGGDVSGAYNAIVVANDSHNHSSSSGDFTINGGNLYTGTSQQRVKVGVWSNDTYGIGMQAGYTFGGITSEYALTNQMSNTNGRGFWWGDNIHTNAQGAMALTTQGYLTVANRIRVGYGESDTTTPSKDLDVNGEASIGSLMVGATTTPAMQLQVKDTTNYHGILVNGSNAPNVCFDRSTGTTPEWKVGISGNDGNSFSISKGTANDDRLMVNSAGQTLINTIDGNMPTAGGNADCVIYGGAGNGFAYNALHVGGGRISLNAQPNSNSTRGYIQCDGAGFKLWHVDNSDMIFGVNDVEKMRIQYADGRIKSQATYDNAAPATHRDVYVENSGQLGYASSVRAHKTNINSYGDASWLYQIDPKTFNYRKPNTTLVTNDDGFTEEVRDGTYSDTEYYDTVEVGFIAEDVEEHDPNLCFYNEVEDEDGNVTNELAGIHYKSMVVPMLKLIKEQKTLIDNLTARITELEG